MSESAVVRHDKKGSARCAANPFYHVAFDECAYAMAVLMLMDCTDMSVKETITIQLKDGQVGVG